jgi:putative endopeptidase
MRHISRFAVKRSLSLVLMLGLSPLTLAAQERHGVDTTVLDRTVKPDVDFYQFANGGWLSKVVIPADKPAIDAFTEVQLRNEALLKAIVEKVAASSDFPSPSVERKIGDFYRTGMDEALAEQLGIKPLEPILDRIDSLSDRQELLKEMARLQKIGVSVTFEFGVQADFKNSKMQILQFGQGGLGLPDRDYYLNDDPQSKMLREQYTAHLTRTLQLAGTKPEQAAEATKQIMALETRLAKASLKREQMRDPNALYHKMTRKELDALTPGMAWQPYLHELGIGSVKEMNVSTPDFFKAVETALAEVPLNDWKAYLRWHTISAFSSTLNKAFAEENFRFSSMLTGQKEQPPRWRRILNATEGALGEAVGKLYVAEAFPPEAKKRAYALVVNLKGTLRERIQNLDWMGDATKAEALKKLDAITIKVGYPDKWKNYDDLVVGTDSYTQNTIRANEFAIRRSLKKINKPVDRSEWGMTPPTVNAYYNPLNNEIVFPAGILQPPFFDAKADDASNYGAIGMVIGHEMTHGFDDQGRQFDAAGNLRDWWTAEDAKKFKERSEALVQQYAAYSATPEAKVNGILTQGENIADLGGLTVAYEAWRKTPQGKGSAEVLDGFTPEQRFFLAFGQIWRFKSSPQFANLLAKLDSHSPAKWRVMGTLVNIPPFASAFGTGVVGSVAQPSSGKVKIW